MTTKPPYQLLKDQRLAKGRTQVAMADALDMDKATYHRLENGERRYLVNDGIAAAAFLGVSFLSVTVGASKAQREAA